MPSSKIFHSGLVGLAILVVGCQTERSGPTPAKMEINTQLISLPEVASDSLELRANLGLMYHIDTPFTGVAVSRYENGNIAEKATYVEGQKNGLKQKWFENGKLSYEANYQANKPHGEVKSWWYNGVLRSTANFKYGVADGVQKQWRTGSQLFKERNLVDGKEEGLQRAWRANGKLFVNYEAKNGRIYGLKRASLCYELANENIVYND